MARKPSLPHLTNTDGPKTPSQAIVPPPAIVEETEEATEVTFVPASRVTEDGRTVHIDRSGCTVVTAGDAGARLHSQATTPEWKKERYDIEPVRQRLQTHVSLQAPPPADLRTQKTFGAK